MTDKNKEKKERLQQIETNTYIEREDVKKDVDKQRGIKPNI